MISDDGKIKLCDFGSCTTKVYQPDENWTSQQRAILEDKVMIFNILEKDYSVKKSDRYVIMDDKIKNYQLNLLL